MKLEQVRFNWDALAREDPLYAVASEPGKQDRGWNEAEFFATGRTLLEQIRARATSLGLELSGSRALDFGCGVGRLSQPLAESYERVDALDLSAAMLSEARERAARCAARTDRIHFLHNTRCDLNVCPDAAYDLVFSFLTLQHMPPEVARLFLGEFAKKLRPGGVLFFQVPEHPHPSAARLLASKGFKARLRSLVPPVWLERYRHWRNGRGRMDMFGVTPEDVRSALGEGVELLASDPEDDTGGLLPSRRYFARARLRT